MRKLVYGTNISLDGCCDHTRFGGDDETLHYFNALLRDVDLIVYGRKTYELMVPFWPAVAKARTMNEAAVAYADTFNAIDRIVVSRTMESVDDEHTLIVREHICDEIRRLKQLPGKTISTGGVELPAQLVEAGLVDEFHVVVHPLITGAGRRLFADMNLSKNQDLELMESRTLANGCLALHYCKR